MSEEEAAPAHDGEAAGELNTLEEAAEPVEVSEPDAKYADFTLLQVTFNPRFSCAEPPPTGSALLPTYVYHLARQNASCSSSDVFRFTLIISTLRPSGGHNESRP